MEVRKIKADEYSRADELFHIAFEFAQKDEKIEAEVEPKDEKWAAFSDSGEMMSCIEVDPFVSNFDGEAVKMAGIGGVSTLAQYRGSGGIRGCFEHILPDLYKDGCELSYLYPFSTGYYEKFGYAMCGDKLRYIINLRSLKHLDGADGEVFLHEGNIHLDDIKKVYKEYTKNFNICHIRSDADFKGLENAEPAKDTNYTYIYKAKNGEPKGVMSFKKILEDDGKFYMACGNAFWFSDSEGLKGLLNFTAAFVTYYEAIRFFLPAHINITSFVAEWAIYPNKIESFSLGMARVIDVKKILLLAKYRGEGSIKIKISDRQLPQNNHTFKADFAGSHAVSVEVDDIAGEDISLSVGDFSRLILGDRSVEELQYMEKIIVNCDNSLLEKIFYKKPIFLLENF